MEEEVKTKVGPEDIPVVITDVVDELPEWARSLVEKGVACEIHNLTISGSVTLPVSIGGGQHKFLKASREVEVRVAIDPAKVGSLAKLETVEAAFTEIVQGQILEHLKKLNAVKVSDL